MIQVDQKHMEIIQSILEKYPYQFYVFGSRAKGKAKKYSDLDLCYKEIIPDSIIAEISEEFENSELPFRVECLAWSRCDPVFQKSISKDLIPLTFT